MGVAPTGGEDDHSPIVRDGLCSLVAVTVEGVRHTVSRAPVEFHGIVIGIVEILLHVQATEGLRIAGRTTSKDKHAVVGREGWQIFVVGSVDIWTQVDGTERDGVLHGMETPTGDAELIADLLLPVWVVQVLTVLVAGDGIRIALHGQLLVAQYKPGFGIAGVNAECLEKQLLCLLVLTHNALFHGPFEQRSTLFVLAHCRQRKQKHQDNDICFHTYKYSLDLYSFTTRRVTLPLRSR